MRVNIPRHRRYPRRPIERTPWESHPWAWRASLWINVPLVPRLTNEQFALAD